MKFATLALLILVLLVSIVNLATSLGIVDLTSYEYRALGPQQMDEIGFRQLAKENGIEVDEAGKIKFPSEMREEMLKVNMLPYTIKVVENEGWKFVAVTSDNLYLFRKRG
ncbi:MAG: hypothetical protein P1V20_04120 [Verrucomicrobiales bacterium]|nr:hypothetical protein [Verrucomicrobiales bacterium]